MPRFCDHPLLEPVAACRMCLVEIEGQPKPQPACAVTVGEGMKVKTQVTSEVALEAQRGVMEFLLINHPLDCPICDKGGECPLQNQAMSHGRGESRFDAVKRTFPKPINVSAQILLDRERCVSCARCTRFAEQIAGDPFIELLERGAAAAGRHQQRPAVRLLLLRQHRADLPGRRAHQCEVPLPLPSRSTSSPRPTVCEHCASGCGLRTDVRRSTVLRRQAGDVPEVNEEWNCDKGRFAFGYHDEGRLEHPLVRDDDGDARRRVVARGDLDRSRGPGRGGLERRGAHRRPPHRSRTPTPTRSSRARCSAPTTSTSARARPRPRRPRSSRRSWPVGPWARPTPTSSTRPGRGARRPRRRGRVADRLPAPAQGRAQGHGCASSRSRRSPPPASPSSVARVLPPRPAPRRRRSTRSPTRPTAPTRPRPRACCASPARCCWSASASRSRRVRCSAAARLAAATGARLGWVPRRAGERGALDAGALAGLLPGGRPLEDDAARAEVAAAWGIDVASPARDDRARPRRGRRRRARRRRRPPSATTRHRPRPPDRWARCSSGASRWPTSPTPTRSAPRSRRCRSSSRSSSATPRSPCAADVVLPVAAIAEKLGHLPRLGGPTARVRRRSSVTRSRSPTPASSR